MCVAQECKGKSKITGVIRDDRCSLVTNTLSGLFAHPQEIESSLDMDRQCISGEIIIELLNYIEGNCREWLFLLLLRCLSQAFHLTKYRR